MDLSDGFCHLKLDEESNRLTKFTIPFSRYRWKVRPFGITSAPDIFQKVVYDNISDLECVLNQTDDMLVFGREKTMEEATADHDRKPEVLTGMPGMRNTSKAPQSEPAINFCILHGIYNNK